MIIIRVQSYILCKRVDYIVVTKTFSCITSCHFSFFPSLFSSPGLPFPADFLSSNGWSRITSDLFFPHADYADYADFLSSNGWSRITTDSPFLRGFRKWRLGKGKCREGGLKAQREHSPGQSAAAPRVFGENMSLRPERAKA